MGRTAAADDGADCSSTSKAGRGTGVAVHNGGANSATARGAATAGAAPVGVVEGVAV